MAPPPAWGGEVKKTLAVMPFQNLTGDAAFDSLGLALADGLITTLAPQEGLMVRPWPYVARYAGKVIEPERVAGELDVSWIISGTGCSSVCTFTNGRRWSSPKPRLGPPCSAIAKP